MGAALTKRLTIYNAIRQMSNYSWEQGRTSFRQITNPQRLERGSLFGKIAKIRQAVFKQTIIDWGLTHDTLRLRSGQA
jgi:hypothetical protein